MADSFEINNFEHMDTQCPVYGLYDTQDNCWLGDETGSRKFTIEDSRKANGMPLRTLAQIAAQTVEIQLGYAPGRVHVREFDEENLRLRDEVPTLMTTLEALVKLEGGAG